MQYSDDKDHFHELHFDRGGRATFFYIYLLYVCLYAIELKRNKHHSSSNYNFL